MLDDATLAEGGPLGGLSAEVRLQLVALRDGLCQLLQDQLAALLVYGAAVEEGARGTPGDVDVVLVLREPSPERCLSIAGLLQLARYRARVEVMLLGEEEVARAADVFPLFYDDIRERHVLLAGRDLFTGLRISPEHRRLRIEQELRQAQARLRRALVDTRGAKDVLAVLLQRMLKGLRSPLLQLARLRGAPCEAAAEAVLRATARLYQVEADALLQVREDPERAALALARLLAAAVQDVDRRGAGDGSA